MNKGEHLGPVHMVGHCPAVFARSPVKARRAHIGGVQTVTAGTPGSTSQSLAVVRVL